MDTKDKQATRIILKKVSGPIPEDSHLKSQFGGRPYFEKGEQWPMTTNNKPLDFVFQIFNDGKIHLPENAKLIQFYYSFENDDLGFDEDGRWLVKVYERLCADDAVILESPTEDVWVRYCEVEYKEVKSEWNPDGDSTNDMFSQLGGYAQWINSNCEPDDKDFQLLFQLDSEYDAGLSWFDAGIVYIFYNPKSGQMKFSMQYC